MRKQSRGWGVSTVLERCRLLSLVARWDVFPVPKFQAIDVTTFSCPLQLPLQWICPHLFSPTVSWTELNGARGYWRTILHSTQDPSSPFPAGASCVTLWALGEFSGLVSLRRGTEVGPSCLHNVYTLLLWRCLNHRFLLIILKHSFPWTATFSFTFCSLKPHPLSSDWQSRRNVSQLDGLPN